MILLGIKIMNFNKVKNCNGKYTKCKCSMLYLTQMMIVDYGIPAHYGIPALGNYKLGIELVIIAMSIKIRNHLIS